MRSHPTDWGAAMIRMFRHYIPLLGIVLAVTEVILFFVIISVMHTLSPAGGGGIGAGPLGLWIATVVVLIMSSVGLYNRDVMFHMDAVLIRTAMTLPLALAAVYCALFLFAAVAGTDFPTRRDVLDTVPGCLLAALVAHGLFAGLVGSNRLRRRVLVIGSGPMAARVARMARGGNKQFLVVGFIDCWNDGERHLLSPRFPLDRLATPQAALDFLRTNEIEEIVVATNERRGLPLAALLECRLRGIAVHDYASFCESEAGFVDLDALQPSWLIYSDGFRMDRGRLVLKAMFDYLIAGLVLMITLPITVPTAIAIKLTSRGPVFFRQERVGLHGEIFTVLKFRSMRMDAEKAGPQWAKVNDDRATMVGRLIRKVRIDEIPQVINVLRGEMSFIGPRPERPVFVESLRKDIPYFDERHRIKPGITGWAQVNYPYGASIEDAKNKLSYDLYYLKNGGIFLDLVVLFQTIRVVLWPSGAR